MNIALKQAAQQTLESLETCHRKFAQVITALRAALYQQPVTTDPVAWFYIENGEVMFGHPNGYRPPDARPLVFGDTHPAPGVPDDVVRDAERYRWLRATTNAFTNSQGERIDVKLHPEEWDAAIDAAMLTAAQAQKGVGDG